MYLWLYYLNWRRYLCLWALTLGQYYFISSPCFDLHHQRDQPHSDSHYQVPNPTGESFTLQWRQNPLWLLLHLKRLQAWLLLYTVAVFEKEYTGWMNEWKPRSVFFRNLLCIPFFATLNAVLMSVFYTTVKALTVANAVSLANIQQQHVESTCFFCSITHQMSPSAPRLPLSQNSVLMEDWHESGVPYIITAVSIEKQLSWKISKSSNSIYCFIPSILLCRSAHIGSDPSGTE